MGALEEIF